jgi:hypothetical protein
LLPPPLGLLFVGKRAIAMIRDTYNRIASLGSSIRVFCMPRCP